MRVRERERERERERKDLVMIKRQSRLGSLLSLFRQRQHHHRLGNSCCLMAAAASSLLFQGTNDPLMLVRSTTLQHAALHHHLLRHHYYHASPNLIQRFRCYPPLRGMYNNTKSELNGRGLNGPSLDDGCSFYSLDDLCKRIDNSKNNIDNNTNNNNNKNSNYHHLDAFGNARGTFAPSPPQLVHDSEIRLEEDDRCINGAAGRLENRGNHHGSPLGFPELTKTEKLVVAVDVDEGCVSSYQLFGNAFYSAFNLVLGNFVSALNRFIADRYSFNHSVSEYHVYEFFKIWNCSRDEADVRVHEFFKTSYFKTGIHPIPGARQALQKLSRFCNFSVVTSRQNAIRDLTIEWIEKHYPGLFQEIHFGNHFALEGQSRTKSDICRSLGAKVLIDDNPRYALECAEVGIRVLLFDYENSYPWCKIESVNQHPLVTKVHSWEEVEHQLFSSTVL